MAVQDRYSVLISYIDIDKLGRSTFPTREADSWVV